MREYFAGLASGVETRLAGARPGEPVARKVLALETARLGERLFSKDGPIAWCGVLAPFDLLNALGVTPCFVEFVGAMLASTGASAAFLDAAEACGFAAESCGYHRAVMGATLQGLMPEPDLVIGTTAPCTGGLAIIEEVARRFGRDLLVLHVPNDSGRPGVSYLAEQFEAMIGFVSDRTGHVLDPVRLRRAVELSNEARALLAEAYDLARAVPSPARRRDLVNLGITISLLFGTEGGVRVARAYRDEFARRVVGGAAPGSSERVRLMWLQNRVQFKSPLEDLLADEHGAIVVVDELNAVTWEPIDPDDPFTGMARRALSIPLTGPVTSRIRHLQALASAYRADGAINPCHFGCRQGTGARGLIERGLKEVGVPVLNLEVDCIDERQFSPGQLRTRLEAFLEMVVGRAKGSRPPAP